MFSCVNQTINEFVKHVYALICMSIQNAKVGKGQKSDKIQFFFFKLIILLSPNKLTKFQGPSLNSYQDSLLTYYKWFDEQMDNQPKSNMHPPTPTPTPRFTHK